MRRRTRVALDVSQCAICRAPRPNRAPDPCLGWLPGVLYACCGHGYIRNAYIVVQDHEDAMSITRGRKAVEMMRRLGGDPPSRTLGRVLVAEDKQMWLREATKE